MPNCTRVTSATVRWMCRPATWFSRPSRAGVRNAWAHPIATAKPIMKPKVRLSRDSTTHSATTGTVAATWDKTATRRPP